MVRKAWALRVWVGGALCGQLVLVSGTHAQQVLLPPPPVISTVPPAVEEAQTNSAGFVDFGSAVPSSALQQTPFQVGPLDLHPHFSYQMLYATGVQSAPGLPQSTLTQNVSPGLLVGFGRNWTLDYTPTWTFYSNNQFHDTLDHAVALNGGLTYGDWRFGFSQSYTRSDTPLIVTGGQTEQQTFLTAVTGSYRFNTVMSMDVAVNQNLVYSSGLTDTREWSGSDWLNYQFWPRLDAGVGIGGGYDNVSMGDNSVFEQYQARVNWRATDVTSLQIHGGLEDRQFFGSGAGDLANPIFGAEIKYAPFPVTALVLDADRNVSSSPLVDQITENTDVTAGLSQRLLKKLFLNVGGGYHWSSYVSTATATGTGRNDQYYSVNASLTCVFLKHGTMGATYQHSGDTSSQTGFGYNSNQYGLQLGFQY